MAHCLIISFIFFPLTAAYGQELPEILLEGGQTTVVDTSSLAYRQAPQNMSNSVELDKHDIGETGFLRDFSKVAIGGKIRVGPEFNASSCVACHTNAGRGLPQFGSVASQMVIKVSDPKGKASSPGGPKDAPGFGPQLHDHATSSSRPDAKVSLKWNFIEGSFLDGTPYELRKPVISIRVAKGKKLSSKTAISLRRSPPMFGTGLLEAVSDSTITELAKESGGNVDGVSGRANIVWNIAKRRTSIGRFGFKAGSPTLRQQIATAYAVDMGVTNSFVPLADRLPDIPDRILSATTFFTQTLAVPAARDQNNPEVIHGKNLFSSLGCSSCHLMTLQTGESSVKALSNQTIHPFTDLLLHDMGDGLADNRTEFLATGSEWKTTPLWGIGLTSIALEGGEENFLHDGRARTLEEAVLWHGGEGDSANKNFQAASQSERAAVIKFLRSL